MVLMAHINGSANGRYNDILGGLFIPGWCGVDFFFVLSGFLMAYGYKASTTVSEFLKKRIIRIVPTYWVYTAAVILFTNFIHPIVSWINVDFLGGMKSFFFIPTNVSVNEMPIIPPAWTLPYEVFFYTICVILMCRGLRCFEETIEIWAAAIVIYNLSPAFGGNLYIDFLFSPLFLEFFAGFFIARIIKTHNVKKAYGKAALAAGIVLLLVSWIGNAMKVQEIVNIHRVIAFGIPYLLIVFGMVTSGETFEFSKKFDSLGNASYSIYLTHFITMVIVVAILNNTKIGILGANAVGLYFEFCLCCVFCVMVGLVAHRFIEKPLVKYLSKVWRKSNVTTL